MVYGDEPALWLVLNVSKELASGDGWIILHISFTFVVVLDCDTWTHIVRRINDGCWVKSRKQA